MISQIQKILDLIDTQTRRGLIGIFVLMLFAALLETAGISLFIPLLHFLTSPEPFQPSSILAVVFAPLDGLARNQLIIIFCVVLAGFFVFKALALGVIIYIQNLFISKHQAIFAQALFKSYLQQSYSYHLQNNSMELIRNITLLSSRLFVKGLLPMLQVLMETLVVTGILTVLLLIAPIPTLAMGAVLGVSVSCYYLLVRNRIFLWGENTIRLDKEILVWINHALGSIKETKLYGYERFFQTAFLRLSNDRAIFLARATTVPQIPRLFIEAVAICALTTMVILYMSGSPASIDTIIPTIGVFAVAAMRLMPSLSKIIGAVTTFRENTSTVNIIYQDVVASNDQWAEIIERTNADEPMPFSKDIVLQNVGYGFPQASELLFRNLNLKIHKGDTIAFVGTSGAGKTTLVDIILGLLNPSEGNTYIDGISLKENIEKWQSLIGYIPQDVYILDDSLRRNIAFGQKDENIDDAQISAALSKAQLNDVLKELPDGLDTMLGENGSRLSGGQRQRIGIARALFHDPEILVMDEATSALDGETEREITSAIHQLSGDKTVLIIAHRLSTVRHCDKIVLMDKGQIAAVGTFEELEKTNPLFKRLVDLSSVKASDVL